MSVLSRYIWKEILLHVAVATSVVLAISLLRRLGSFIGDAADGSLSANAIFELLSLRTIMGLPSLLTIGIYLGAVLGLGRLHKDQEMIALAACGIAPLRLAREVFQLAFAGALVVAVMSLFVRSWAAGEFDAVRKRAVQDVHVSQLASGRFWEVAGTNEQVIFIGERAKDGTVREVFVQERQGDDLSILFAERAVEQVDNENGYRFLTLLDGYRYDLWLDHGKYEVTNYAAYATRAEIKAVDEDEGSARADSPAELMAAATPAATAELQWRLALPVSAVLLAFIAIPLSRVGRTGPRYARWFAAIVIYLLYNQLLNTARHWVASGTLPAVPGLWAVHLLFAAVAAVLLTRDANLGGWGVGRSGAAQARQIASPRVPR